MTDKDHTAGLAERIEALLAKAMPGPWGHTPMVPLARNYFYLVGNREGNNAEVDIGTIGPSLSPSTEANAALIVALVNAAPTIIAALKERDRLREALETATALIGHQMPMDATALVAGEKLVAKEVWQQGMNALGFARAALAQEEPR